MCGYCLHRICHTRHSVFDIFSDCRLGICKEFTQDGSMVVQSSMVCQVLNQLDQKESVPNQRQVRHGVGDEFNIGIHMVFHRQHQSSVVVRHIHDIGGYMGMEISRHCGRT